MASTVPPCGRGSVQPLWDSTKGKYVEVECPQHHHPSALRNRVPILRALMEYLPGGEGLVGDAAEISAGTGALLELLAPAFPNITWTPTEFIPPQASSVRTVCPRGRSHRTPATDGGIDSRGIRPGASLL